MIVVFSFLFKRLIICVLLLISITYTLIAQECVYPDVQIDFDSLTQVSENDKVKMNHYNSSLIDGYINSGSLGATKYKLKTTDVVSITYEFMFKHYRNSDEILLIGGGKSNDESWLNPLKISIKKDKILLIFGRLENGKISSYNKEIKLNGESVLSPDLYFDCNWHHLVLNYNLIKGDCQLFVDGATCEEFILEDKKIKLLSKLPLQGTINPHRNKGVIIDNVSIYIDRTDFADQIATHGLFTEDNSVFDFCRDSLDPIIYSRIMNIDTLEYHLGFNSDGNCSNCNDIIGQLKSYPVPRYKTNHTLNRNFPWIDYYFIGGRGLEEYSRKHDLIADRALNFQDELIKNWNYSCTVFPSGEINKLEGKFNLAANKYTEVSSVMRINWNFVRPHKVVNTYSQKAYIKNNDLRKSYYFKSPNNQKKYFRPSANLEPIRIDGLFVQDGIIDALNILKRPIDLINENGEIPALIYGNFKMESFEDKSISNQKVFLSNRVTEIRNTYKNEFLCNIFLKNTKFSYYSIDGRGGHTGYDKKYDWDIIKEVNSQMNSYYYSTMDFYPHSPAFWDKSPGASHGYSWVKEARLVELVAGDILFSPFICAGWSNDPAKNLRPAQYLALLKTLGVLGAEFYYSAYFNKVAPEYVVQDPKKWVWQLAMPSYAQAIISKSETILFKGDVLKDNEENYVFDVPDDLVTSLNVVRQHKLDEQNHFLITSSLQTKTNLRNVTNGNYKDVTIKKTGDLPKIKLKSAYEGRTYVLELQENLAPVFYCLDGWHEPYHPERWSENIVIEAELYDQADELLVRKTINNKTREEYSIEDLDFTDFTTFVSSADSENYQAYNVEDSPQLKYSFQPRAKTSNPEDFAMWINMRKMNHSDGSKLGVVITEVSTGKVVFKRIINALLTDEFNWYKLELGKEGVYVKNQENYSVEFLFLDNQFEVDKLMFTFNQAENTKYTPVFSEYVDSELSFEVAKTCGTDLYVENMTFVSDNDFTFSYTVSKNWFRSLKSGKNLTEPLKHKKSKFYITGTRINNDIVQESWWNEDYWKPKFELDFSKKKKAYVKLEMFKDGKRVGKEKQKIYLSELPKIGLDISKQEICKGDTMTVFKEFDTQEVSNVLWSPSLYLLDENDTKATFMPYKTSYIYVQGNDKNGCEVKDSIVVKVNEVNMNYTGAKHIQICDGEKGPLELSTDVEGGNGPYELDWREVEVKQLHEKDSKYFIGNGKIPLNDELLELQITDQDGCRTKEYIFLQVLDKHKCKNE